MVLRAAIGIGTIKPELLAGTRANTSNEWSKLLAQAPRAGVVAFHLACDLEEYRRSRPSAEVKGLARLDVHFAPFEWANLRLLHEVPIGFASMVRLGLGFHFGKLHLDAVDSWVEIQSPVRSNHWPCRGYPPLGFRIVVIALESNGPTREMRTFESENAPLSYCLHIVTAGLLLCCLVVGDGLLRVHQIFQRFSCASPTNFAFLHAILDPRAELLAYNPCCKICSNIGTLVTFALDDGFQRHPC